MACILIGRSPTNGFWFMPLLPRRVFGRPPYCCHYTLILFFDVRHLSLKWSSCASCNVLLEQQHVARANSVAVGRWLGSMLMFEAFPRLRFVDVCGLISTNCFHKSRSRIWDVWYKLKPYSCYKHSLFFAAHDQFKPIGVGIPNRQPRWSS